MTDSDKKEMKSLVYDVVADALEQVVFPKFDSIDERFNQVDEKIDNLTQAVEILDSDTGGVKMRLKVVEEKLDGFFDTSLVVRDHERRIKKLERAVI